MHFNIFTLRRHNPAGATCMCVVVNAGTCGGSELLNVTRDTRTLLQDWS